jgi:hypothetical protein
MEPGARILSLRSALPPRACREVPRRRQSMRRGPAAWGAGQFYRFGEGSSFSKVLLTPTLVKKFSKVLPTVTYCDFGPPAQRFGATSRRDELARRVGATSWRDELARQVAKTVLKFEVCHDEMVKKPSKTPATTLMVNDLM